MVQQKTGYILLEILFPLQLKGLSIVGTSDYPVVVQSNISR